MTLMLTYAKFSTPELHFSLCLAQSRILHKLSIKSSNFVPRGLVTLVQRVANDHKVGGVCTMNCSWSKNKTYSMAQLMRCHEDFSSQNLQAIGSFVG